MLSSAITHPLVVLEPAAQAFAEATNTQPYLFQLGPVEGRQVLDELQTGEIYKPELVVTYTRIPGGPANGVSLRIVRSNHALGPLPAILYIHGAGWVFGGRQTHDRLVRELADRTGAAAVFVSYSRSPEARYPVAIEECYAALQWIAEQGADEQLDGTHVVVAGDSVGGNMSAALTLIAKERSGPELAGQVLFYPVTDASFDTASYHEFAEGYHFRRDAMEWFWEQYLPDHSERGQITASPLRSSIEQLEGLPSALVITAEADVLRDEGEAYAAKLRQAGVAVTAVRYEGMIHDFVMLNALRQTHAAEAAISQAIAFIKQALEIS